MDKSHFEIENRHLSRFLPFLDNLNRESNRGRVLIAGGFLEELLGQILLGFMLEDSKSEKLVKGRNAPLGSFSSRIDACYALGLISEREHAELTLIRRIRNDFAHDIDASFDTQSITDRCEALTYKASVYEGMKGTINASSQFTSAAVALILNLINRAHYVSEHRCDQRLWSF